MPTTNRLVRASMDAEDSEAEALRAAVREFARGPLAEARLAGTPPREMIPAMAERGWMGSIVPTDLGGSASGLVASCIIAEELAQEWPSLAAMRSISAVFVAYPLLVHATAEQCERYLGPLCRGQAIYALGITEPSAGSDARGIQTRAVRDGDEYVIDGFKHYISCSSEGDAILAYILTDPDAPAGRQLSAFMVPTDAPGLDADEWIETVGLKDISHAKVHFKAVRVHESARIGGEGDGLRVLMDTLDPERVDIASRAVGCGARALEEARRHAAQREQFGRAIREFQAVSHGIADMRTDVDAARLLTMRAARLCDQGEPCAQEAAMAKLHAGRRGWEVCDTAMQVCGALGFAESHIVSLMLRDVRALRFGGGTDEIMRHVIQREEFAKHPSLATG